jgi:polyferredoxin
MLNKINILIGKTWFPIFFKIIAFIAFWGLIYFGLSASTDNPFLFSQIYRTNLTTLFVWDTWWPLIILSTIVFGRVWCMVCPVEMITSFFSKIGLRQMRPQWLISGWVIPLFYAIIVIIGVTILQIDLNPKWTAWYLLIIVGIASVSGLIFEKNTFCRYICPVGYLLGIFSKISVWGWRVKNKSVCKVCRDKSCINEKYTYQQNYKSCGVDLIRAEISDNSNCILCTGCLKTCKSYKTTSNTSRPNPGIVKNGFARELLQIKPLLLVEWVFLYFLTAHLIYEVSEFPFISDLKNTISSESISNYFNIKAGLGKDIIAASYLFFLLPLFLWGLPYILILISKVKMSIVDYLKNFSLVFLPIVVGLFVELIIFEVTVRLPYYKYILRDPLGVKTIQGILTRQIVLAKLPDWTQWAFLITLVILLTAGVYLSVKVIKQFTIKFKLQENRSVFYTSTIVFVVTFFVAVLLYQSF